MSDQALVAQQPVAVLTVDTEAGPILTVVTQQVAVFVAAAGQGAAGRDGRDGLGSTTTVFHQDSAASTWTIHHGLGRYPSVTLVDTAGDLFGAACRYPDANTVIITMNAPTAGAAFLN